MRRYLFIGLLAASQTSCIVGDAITSTKCNIGTEDPWICERLAVKTQGDYIYSESKAALTGNYYNVDMIEARLDRGPKGGGYIRYSDAKILHNSRLKIQESSPLQSVEQAYSIYEDIHSEYYASKEAKHAASLMLRDEMRLSLRDAFDQDLENSQDNNDLYRLTEMDKQIEEMAKYISEEDLNYFRNKIGAALVPLQTARRQENLARNKRNDTDTGGAILLGLGVLGALAVLSGNDAADDVVTDDEICPEIYDRVTRCTYGTGTNSVNCGGLQMTPEHADYCAEGSYFDMRSRRCYYTLNQAAYYACD